MSFHDESQLDLNDSDNAAGHLGPQYDLDACVALMRGGSKSFFAASKLLPPRVRSASIALYAFCRVADDVVDEGEDPAEGLRQLRRRLDCIYQGNPENHLEDHALALVVHQHTLPRALLDGLLDGFAWDAMGTRYDTMEALHGYCARVAGTVGAMMAWIMGARASNTLARACELGVAMQLTNIARDVGEDARNGRIYLPLDWVRAEGLDPKTWLENPCDHPAIRRVVARMLEHADALYLQSTPGIADLPRDCRAAIQAARLIYAEIGHQLVRSGLNSVDQRTVVSSTRKMVLIGQAQLQAVWDKPSATSPPPLEGIRFLVEACQDAAGPTHALPQGFPNRSITERILWMINLFERLSTERRQQSMVRQTMHYGPG